MLTDIPPGAGTTRKLVALSLRRRPWRCPPLLILLGTSAAIGILMLILGPIALWAAPTDGLQGKDRADAINTTRQILLTAAGGLALLVGATFASRTYYLSRRGQLTDRYIKAITLLASEQITERLGGIYAMEHLMIESDRDHETVLEVLAAFIRERASTSRADGATDSHDVGDDHPLPATDIQAALTVLGRRSRRPERNHLDLEYADLCGYSLSQLNLDGANFGSTQLQFADMMGTSLTEAWMMGAQLQNAKSIYASFQRAELYDTNLQEAWLIAADFRGANLSYANLRGAYLPGAKFHGANLHEAQLQGADFVSHPAAGPSKTPPLPISGLTVEQLATAKIDDATRLPEELRTLLNAQNTAEPS